MARDDERQSFTEAWEQWHRQKERILAGPHGFLAITSLHWLGEEPARFEDAPGTWSSTAKGVVVELAEDEELTVDGQAVPGRYEFGLIAERDSRYAGAGDALIEVAKRGGHDILRPRHPGNPLRTAFTHTPVYAPDPRWVLEGHFLPFGEPRPVTVGATVEGLEHVYDSPGQVEFDFDGAVHRLTAFNGKTPGSLMVLFTDRTSGVTTYAANRSLHIEAPDAEGRVNLDFNRAGNLPCAYTDLATCPLPPTENRLPFAVEAGERIPLERGGQP
ncbi:hypothetical protein GCM10014715_86850 [Streptomyces spiralis]|uniref:DUF1684 domain-containing protein n=1 Tax=Streptomyces spiralis TaxID=66376 RepID=A0A919APC7_9ACTN|nr:DUF1684 domain-containing protein [Streptomyces spiralis]GHF18560.1 hypothetical protein GCM10014715_86850 [Streptomyces spiralis]